MHQICLTCQCAGVSEGSDLGVGQPSQEGDDVVHHVLVVDDAVLTLTNEHLYKLTKVDPETLPVWTRHDQWIVPTVLHKQKSSLVSHINKINHINLLKHLLQIYIA